MIAQAQSGTGKTATFSISILQSIDVAVRETQALVLSPTRELATQIQSVLLALGDYMNVQCHACIGGTSIGEDIRKLEYGQHVVSGTPGRVFDMIRRRSLRTRNIKMLVLDEADELLNKGFKDQIYEVYRYLPPATQVVLLSATLPYDVLEMTTKFMTDPIRILVKRDELTLEGIKQFFVAVEKEEWKFDILRPVRCRDNHPRCHLLQHQVKGQSFIFFEIDTAFSTLQPYPIFCIFRLLTALLATMGLGAHCIVHHLRP